MHLLSLPQRSPVARRHLARPRTSSVRRSLRLSWWWEMNGNLVVQKRLVFLHCTEHFGPFWVHSFNGWPREITRNRATSTCSTASTPCSPSAEGPSVRSPTELERSQSGCRRGRIVHIPGAQNHVLLARRCGRESLSHSHIASPSERRLTSVLTMSTETGGGVRRARMTCGRRAAFAGGKIRVRLHGAIQ